MPDELLGLGIQCGIPGFEHRPQFVWFLDKSIEFNFRCLIWETTVYTVLKNKRKVSAMDAGSMPINLLALFLGQTFLRWKILPSQVYQLLSPVEVSPFTHRGHSKRGKTSTL